MNTNMTVKTVAFCALALAGCATETPEPNTPASSLSTVPAATGHGTEQPTAPAKATGAEAVLHIDENLARLRAIGVFNVGQLVIEYPEGSVNCYGPCAGQEATIQAAKEKAAVALATFADRAEIAAKSPPAGPCTAAVEANIAALGALKIVDVQGFAKTTPASHAHCYNLPCHEDLEEAKTADAVKACKLEAIVRATKG